MLNGGVYISSTRSGRAQSPPDGRNREDLLRARARSRTSRPGARSRASTPVRSLTGLFQAAGIPAEYHEDIRSAIWEKYLFISPLASASTALGQTFGELQADPRQLGAAGLAC